MGGVESELIPARLTSWEIDLQAIWMERERDSMSLSSGCSWTTVLRYRRRVTRLGARCVEDEGFSPIVVEKVGGSCCCPCCCSAICNCVSVRVRVSLVNTYELTLNLAASSPGFGTCIVCGDDLVRVGLLGTRPRPRLKASVTVSPNWLCSKLAATIVIILFIFLLKGTS